MSDAVDEVTADQAGDTAQNEPLAGDAQAADAAEPADIDGYQKLVEKLRGDVRTAKADRTPQADKDRKMIASLRKQVAEADPAKIKAEFAAALAKAMGVEEEAPDPAKLTEQLTAQTGVARQAQVELAVYRAAGSLEGDPARLLDSRSFMNAVANVDPTDATAVSEAIKTALEANPDLKVTPARRLPAPNPALGSSAAGAPDLESQIVTAQKAGDWKTVVALQNQKLATQK